MSSQIAFTLNEAPNRRTKYFIGIEDTLHPIDASVLLHQQLFQPRSNSDLARLIQSTRTNNASAKMIRVDLKTIQGIIGKEKMRQNSYQTQGKFHQLIPKELSIIVIIRTIKTYKSP